MGWEPRPGGVYYYRNLRVGCRATKQYLGRGPAAELAALVDAAAREERRAAAMALTSERARLRPLDEAMTALDDPCNLMVEAVLTAAGFRRQNYSAWRRRRVPEVREAGGRARRG